MLSSLKSYPGLVRIPKQALMPYIYQKAAGSSRVGPCNYKFKSQEAQMACKEILSLRKQIAATIDGIVKTKLEDRLSVLVDSHCKNCVNYTSSRISPQHNLTRYGVTPVTLANLKIFLALHTFVPINGEIGEIRIRRLAAMAHLSIPAVRGALKYWAEQGMIEYASIYKGIYRIQFTAAHNNLYGLKAEEGGAGYIQMPYAYFDFLMQLDRVSSLRLGLVLVLNLDRHLYYNAADDFRQVGSDRIEVSLEDLGYTYRPVGASFDQILRRFESDARRILGDNSIDLFATVYDFDSDHDVKFFVRTDQEGENRHNNDGRFYNMGAFFPKQLAPKQNRQTKYTDRQAAPWNCDGLSADTIAACNKAADYLFGSPLDPGYDFSAYSAAKNLLPVSGTFGVESTLIEAIVDIQNRVGSWTLPHAIKATFKRFKAELIEYMGGGSHNRWKDGLSWDDFKDTLHHMAAYMTTIAQDAYKQQLLTPMRA